MGSIEVVELATEADGPLFDGAVELERVLSEEADPAGEPENAAWYRARRRSTATFSRQPLIAVDDGLVVGRCEQDWHSIEGNTDKLQIALAVHPDHRRRGIGRALLSGVIDHADALRRSNVIAIGPMAESTDAFWNAHGAPCALVEQYSRLILDQVDPGLMESWIAAPEARAAGYRMVRWKGSTPEVYVASLAELYTAMNDAPLEELDYADDNWTTADIRDLDANSMLRGVDRWVSVALAADDSAAGMTVVDIVTPRPSISYQQDTVVTVAHRGHGLGRWLKADMWQRLRAEAPQVRALDTENAASNVHMLAINDAMGYMPLYEGGVWQAPVETIRAHIH